MDTIQTRTRKSDCEGGLGLNHIRHPTVWFYQSVEFL